MHMPYGNGSLHILREDVVALVAELQRLYYGPRLTDARPNSSTGPSEAIHNPGGNRIHGSNDDNGNSLSRLLEDRWNSRHHMCAHDNAEK